MAITVSVQIGASVLGDSYSQDVSVLADVGVSIKPTLAPAVAGTLTTYTSSTAGTLTMSSSGHGISTGNRIDIYLANGKHLYGCTVGTVSGTSVPFTTAAGDSLISGDAGQAVVAMVADLETMSIIGANVNTIALRAPNTADAIFVFTDSSGTLIFAKTLLAGQSYVWTNQMAVTNPVTGSTIGRCYVTHGDSVNSQSMTAAICYN